MSYPLRESENELQWQSLQNAFYEELMGGLLQQVGIQAGMRILDLGCGIGGITFPLARMVGRDGQVVGVDSNHEAVKSARAKANAENVKNAEFRCCEIQTAVFEERFDIVAGRFILMYLPNPSSAVRRMTYWLRPGGRFVAIEPDYSYSRSVVSLPIFQQIHEAIERTMNLCGADTRIGLKLRRVFCEAGLHDPELRLCAAIGGGSAFGGYDVAAGMVGLLLPAMERFGIATRSQLSRETLAARLRDELSASNGDVVVFPALVAAWASTSGLHSK